MALEKFSKAFNLQDTKAVMPYNLYTESNIKTCFIPIQIAKYFVKNDDEKELENNIDKWDLRRDDDTYDIVEYSKIYCQLDCSLLKKGYEAFRNIMLDVTGLDVDNYCTIQGLALDYVLKEGCFDGVVMISGVPQQFISNCVVGGRCMTNSNKMYHVVGKLADFDAVGLYSSSLYRIDGFLKGTPKVLKNLTKEFLESVDGYFIRVKILSVGKNRQFPLLSKIDEYGVRIFTNDMVGTIVFIDRVGLEDAIKYQDIKFKIIDGYYFDEGRNNKINKVIKHLFDERKKMKEDKNPAEKTVKLLMNSIYGKTILKPIDTETKVIPEWKKDDYLFRHYNFIKECIKVGNNYYVKLIKSINEHFNYVHCGVEVLSTSKRIMNEVMCLAEDEGLSIFYQDTDSLHIIYDEVEKLRKAFKRDEKRELVGTELGQFHIDFDLDGMKKGADIFSIESYFLGKKDYYDRLQTIDEDDEVLYGNHIRCKGIPTPCVLQKAKELEIEPIDIYKKKYNGESIIFNLTERVDGKPKFKNQKDYSVTTMRRTDKGVTRKSEIRDAGNKRIKTIYV